MKGLLLTLAAVAVLSTPLAAHASPSLLDRVVDFGVDLDTAAEKPPSIVVWDWDALLCRIGTAPFPDPSDRVFKLDLGVRFARGPPAQAREKEYLTHLQKLYSPALPRGRIIC